MSAVKLEKDWLDLLQPEFDAPYMAALKKFLQSEKEAGKTVYPKGTNIFNALNIKFALIASFHFTQNKITTALQRDMKMRHKMC